VVEIPPLWRISKAAKGRRTVETCGTNGERMKI